MHKRERVREWVWKWEWDNTRFPTCYKSTCYSFLVCHYGPLQKQWAKKIILPESITLSLYLFTNICSSKITLKVNVSFWCITCCMTEACTWGASVSIYNIYKYILCIDYLSTESREWIQRCFILGRIAAQGCVFPYSPLLKGTGRNRTSDSAVNSINVNLSTYIQQTNTLCADGFTGKNLRNSLVFAKNFQQTTCNCTVLSSSPIYQIYRNSLTASTFTHSIKATKQTFN